MPDHLPQQFLHMSSACKCSFAVGAVGVDGVLLCLSFGKDCFNTGVALGLSACFAVSWGGWGWGGYLASSAVDAGHLLREVGHLCSDASQLCTHSDRGRPAMERREGRAPLRMYFSWVFPLFLLSFWCDIFPGTVSFGTFPCFSWRLGALL